MKIKVLKNPDLRKYRKIFSPKFYDSLPIFFDLEKSLDFSFDPKLLKNFLKIKKRKRKKSDDDQDEDEEEVIYFQAKPDAKNGDSDYKDTFGLKTKHKIKVDDIEPLELAQGKKRISENELKTEVYNDLSGTHLPFRYPVLIDAGIRENIFNVKYETPVWMNRQWTYQRVFIDAQEETTVYDLTVGAAKSGIPVNSRYDKQFNAMIINSIDGKRDGEDGRWWEFYINGRIGEVSADQQVVKKGDVIEWRLATEQDYGCGGGGDPQNDSQHETLKNRFRYKDDRKWSDPFSMFSY